MVHYTPTISNARFLNFAKLLLRWRGSLWKLVLPDLCIWIVLYILLSLIYRFALTEAQQMMFEKVCISCHKSSNFIPVIFILGFFVSFVTTRWWFQYNKVGWIDDMALLMHSYVCGTCEKSRMIRRTLLRYLLLVQALVFRDISSVFKKKYPTIQSLIEPGYITNAELQFFPELRFWQPILWGLRLIVKARREGFIVYDSAVSQMFLNYNNFRTGNLRLTLEYMVPVPLVYTQVAFTSIRIFFIVSVLGSQYLSLDRSHRGVHMDDAYVPFLTVVEFVFLMGYLKVAEVLINPFGEDDTDFETFLFLQRNLEVALAVVDHDFAYVPSLKRDSFWDEKKMDFLYTVETAKIKQNPLIGSAVMSLKRDRSKPEDVELVPRLYNSLSELELTKIVLSHSTSVPAAEDEFCPDHLKAPAPFWKRRKSSLAKLRYIAMQQRTVSAPAESVTDNVSYMRDFYRGYPRMSKDGRLDSVEEVDEAVDENDQQNLLTIYSQKELDFTKKKGDTHAKDGLEDSKKRS